MTKASLPDSSPDNKIDGGIRTTELRLPIQLCAPRCYLLDATIDRDRAIQEAGEYRTKVFGPVDHIRSQIPILRNEQYKADLVEYRLTPFWHVRCTSHFNYSFRHTYHVQPVNPDAVEIAVPGVNAVLGVWPVIKTDPPAHIELSAVERCVTDLSHTAYYSAYNLNKGAAKAKDSAVKPSLIELDYSSLTARPKSEVDFEQLLIAKRAHGEILQDGIPDDKVRVLVPEVDSNQVADLTLEKVKVGYMPFAMHESLNSVELCDLYYRPYYVFRFSQSTSRGTAKKGDRWAQLDAYSGEWTETAEVDQAKSLPVEKILLLTLDATTILLEELGGPTARIVARFIDLGVTYAISSEE